MPGDEGSRRLWCDVGRMNVDTQVQLDVPSLAQPSFDPSVLWVRMAPTLSFQLLQVVRMNNYLDTKLVGSALTTDHDIWAQFHHWYDQVNIVFSESQVNPDPPPTGCGQYSPGDPPEDEEGEGGD